MKANIEQFEDLKVWQDARRFVHDVYGISGEGPFAKDFGLRDQICRASVSIMSNIAEGFERASRKDFVRFLDFSKASAAEVRSQLYIALDLGYIDEATFMTLRGDASSLSKQLAGFVRYLKQ